MSATLTYMSYALARRKAAQAAQEIDRARRNPQKRTHPQPGHPDRAITLRSRGSRPLRTDMRVRYAEGVAARSVDRQAWANTVSNLIEQETRGNKTRFANLVGVSYKTVLRWLAEESDVSEESVRQVARAIGVPPMQLLVRVGFYAADELAATEPAAAAEDPALREILESDLPTHRKQRLIQRLQQMRARDTEREVDEVRWWIDQARGA